MINEILNLAKTIARSAGKLIQDAWQNPEKITISEKAPRDLVTAMDKTVEQYIISLIQARYPDHSILSEEAGLISSTVGNEFKWIIDPIDGTSNFSRRIPHFAVSIGVALHDELVVGVIYDPIRQELFSAAKAQGAYLNENPIQVSAHHELLNAMIATGFPSKCQQFFPAFLSCLQTIFPDVLGIRRAGAAALDLAYVAAGRLDGYWEIDIRDWDIAAGTLLVTEAGGKVCDLGGNQNFPEHGIIAGTLGINPVLVKQFKLIWENELLPLFMNASTQSTAIIK